MWLLVCRNHRIIQHLALWSSRAPFLSSLLTISHHIIRFGDYFNFKKDLCLSVQFASWMNSLEEVDFFFFYRPTLNKILFGDRDLEVWRKFCAWGGLVPSFLLGHRQMSGTVSLSSGNSSASRDAKKHREWHFHLSHTTQQSVLPRCQNGSTGGPVRSTKPFKVYCPKPYCKLNILCRVLKEAREK